MRHKIPGVSVFLMFMLLSLQACSVVDDYILGKDNTPTPKALTPIQSKVNLVSKWSVPVGKSMKGHTYLKMDPVIYDQVIYTADPSGLVHAVDRRRGTVLWSHSLNKTIVSGPTVSGRYLVFGTDASTILLLQRANGRVVWESKLSEDVLAKSVIADHKVISKTIDGNVYAFDITTGETAWVADHGAPSLILKASASPVVLGRLVLVGFSDGKLDAIDINTGHLVWQRSISFASGSSDVERLVDIDSDPILSGTTAYLASYQGYVGALSLTDGQFIWNKPASVYKNMAMDDHAIYITDSHDVLWAFEKQTGQVRWKQKSLKARGLTEPVLINHHLLVGDRLGYLHVMNIQNGELIGRMQVDGPIHLSPVVAGHFVYVMTANGKLNCIRVS